MLFADKAAWTGIVFILLTTGISGPRPTLIASEPNLRNEVPIVEHPTDVNKIQETLRNREHGICRGVACEECGPGHNSDWEKAEYPFVRGKPLLMPKRPANFGNT